MNKRWSRRWRWPARILAVAGSCLALWIVFRKLDGAVLLETLRTMEVRWFLAAAGVFGLGLLTSSIRWHLMLRLNHEAVVHGAASVRMVFISQFFNTVFGGPSAGDVPKTALYSRWFGVPAADVLAASVLDRLVSSIGGLLFAFTAVGLALASGGFDFLGRLEWHLPGRTLAVAGVVVVAAPLLVLAWGARRPDSFVGRAVGSLRASARRLLGSRRRTGHALACAVTSAVLFNLTQVFCLQAVSDTPVPWPRLFWMYHVVTLVSSLPVTFAGTGLREGTSMVLLRQYDIPGATAVAGAMLTLIVHLGWASVGAFLLWREQRCRRGLKRDPAPLRISVVVPVLNEAAALPATLEALARVPEVTEVIVVDGGSTDATAARAAEQGCRVIVSAPGRGQQMATGAEQARGNVVWFVHADTWVEPGAGAAMARCLRDPLVVGGGFWKRFREAPLVMRGSRLRCWLRLWWGGRVLGDQALFVRREVLTAAGGMPRQPLMEEIELCRRLRQHGRLALAGAAVTTSIRRFRQHGIWRTYWRMWRVSRGYRRGVPPAELVRWYERGR